MKTEKFEKFIAALDDIDANDIYSMFGRYAAKDWNPEEYIQYLEKLYIISKEAADEVFYNLPLFTDKDCYANVIVHQIISTAHEYLGTYINYFSAIDFEDIDLYSDEELDAMVISHTELFSETEIKQSVWHSFVIYFFTRIFNFFHEYDIDLCSKLNKFPEVISLHEIESIDPFNSSATNQKPAEKNNESRKDPIAFSTLLINCKEDELIEALKEKYQGAKGRLVAAIIKALKDSNCISSVSNAQIYKSMKKDLWDIGSKSTINGALNPQSSRKVKEEEIKPIMEFISEYKKQPEK